MSVVPYLEFCRRQDNVIYLPAFRLHGRRRAVLWVENAEEKTCEPTADPGSEVAATLWQDGTLMVGG